MSTETIKQKFYGWRMVVGANLVDFFSAGFGFYIYPIFALYLIEEFSLTVFIVNLTFSITIAAAGIYSPFMGYVLDKFSIKKVVSVGAMVFGFGFILLSFTQNFYQFLCIYALLIALGMVIFGNLSTSKLISNWFNDQIGVALGYASIGLSLSGVILPVIAEFLIESFTWRVAYFIFGLFALFICSFFAFKFFIDAPEDVNQLPDGKEVLETKLQNSNINILSFNEILSNNVFRVLTVIFTLQFTANLGVYTQIAIVARDLELSPVSWIVAFAAFNAAVGKIIFGKLLSILEARKTILISLFFHGFGILLLIFSSNISMILVSLMIMSLGLGGNIPLMNSTFAIAFGNTNFGKARGLASPFMVPFQIIAAPLSGLLYDTYGNYTFAFSIHVVLCIIAGIVVLFLHLPDRK